MNPKIIQNPTRQQRQTAIDDAIWAIQTAHDDRCVSTDPLPHTCFESMAVLRGIEQELKTDSR